MKKEYYLGIILFVLCNIQSFEGRSQWIQVLSGGVSTVGPQVVAMAASSSGKLFAGTIKGGIYVSDNNGASWSPSNKGLTDGTVNSFCVNSSSIFVSMNSGGGVLRSSNDGESWSKVNNGLPQAAVVNLKSTNGRVFALVNNGSVFYSDNDGNSWSQLTNVPANVTSLARSGTTIFLGSSSGTYRSIDTGATWLLVNAGNVIRLDASDNTVVVRTTGGMLLSTNNGSSWNSVGIPANYPNIAQIGSTILVSYSIGPMWRSVDNGASWTIVPNVPTAGNLISVGSNFFASTSQGVYLSQDDGVTWFAANIGLVNAQPALSVDGSTIITTNGTTVGVSQDWGATWTSQIVGSAINISVLAKNNVLYVSNRNGVFSSVNKGLTWSSIPSLGVDKILGFGGANLYAVDSYYLYRSVSDGTWTEQSSNVRWITSFAAKDNKVFAGSTFGGDVYTGVFSSVNEGATWQQVNNTLPQINSMAYDGTLLICGTSAGVYKSMDGGVTWTLAGLEGSNINSVIFYDGSIMAAHKGISISNNNGVSWTSITGEISASLGSFHEITTLVNSGTRLLAATSTGSIWISKCIDPPRPTVTGTWSHHPTTLTSSAATNYQWFLNGNEIAGATGQNIEVTASGNYSVKVMVDGCPSEISEQYVITDCISPPTPTVVGTWSHHPTTLTSSSATNNQWFLNGNEIAGATGQNIEVTASGNYSVKVIVDGCPSEISAQYMITDCVLPPTPIITTLVDIHTTLTSSASAGNQWFLNGTVIQNATDQNYTPTVNGTYTVQVTIDGCKSNISLLFPLIVTGEIPDQNPAIKIYPNPVIDKLIINNESGSTGRAVAEIFDLFGRQYDKVIADNYPISVNTSFLASGIYIIEINQSGKIFRRRFVKK